MDAEKVEKVERGLKCCNAFIYKDHDNCPYASMCDYNGVPKMLISDSLTVIRELKAEVEQLKYEKEKAVRDIGLYIADAEEDARTPSRIGKGYYVGEQHGLQIAKDIVEGIRNHG